MQKSDITVAIVEDDVSFGLSLSEAISRSGYATRLFKNPDEILKFLQLNSAQAYIIDCMLPKMNGVDLAGKIKENAAPTDCLVLMSGIYRDKNFSKTSIKKVGAQEFLFKPFDFQDLIKILDDHFADALEKTVSSPLYEIMTEASASTRQKIKAINNSENVHGFDLPWIFALLMDERITGYLTIVLPNGEVAGVGFHEGGVVQVSLKDTKSYFGSLLIERGFISAEEFDQVFKTAGQSKRIGEYLVDSGYLSPHAIEIVVGQQLGIRLSKLVQDDSMTVNFNKSDEVQIEARFDDSNMAELLDTWIGAKISVEWMKSLYLPLAHYQIRKGPNYSLSHRSLSLPLLARVPNLMEELVSSTNIESLLDQAKYDERIFYQALHMLIVTRLIVFDPKVKSLDLSAHKKRLSKLNKELEVKNHFDRLGISQTAKENEIKRSYHELAKALHPDTLDSQTPKEIVELTKNVFDKIQVAYDILKNKTSRTAYLKELEHGKAEFIFKADGLTERGKGLLKVADWSSAYQMFDEASKLCPPNSELKLLLAWTRMKTAEPKKNDIANAVIEVQKVLREVSPEDRHNATYYLVRGLLQRAEGRNDEALKSFNHALHIEPNFIHARRELSLLKEDKNGKPVDLLRGDLKDVVGLLFKKKK